MRSRTALLVTLLFVVATAARGQAPVAGYVEHTPAPDTVSRWEKGYRYPQAGWIVLHIEGAPYERGVQHGRLLASEIAAYARCFALTLSNKAPDENWRRVRTFSQALFLRKFDKEFLEEMKGIADGASAAGARVADRPIDLVDILVLNCWCEIEALEQANAATPTGLEGFKGKALLAVKPGPPFERCSAFVAAGPATPDGRIVFGHVTMSELYPANFCNIWMDVQPTSGHRFVMCGVPGGIQSSLDYYLNDAGILLSETTLPQTSFDINGITCASRVRKAIQYADSIDKAVEYLVRENNGLYTNEWLLADVNTNEIAMLDLGTHRHKLWRSSKNEWFGNTPGFYWGCNTCKDMDVRLETIASAKARPSKVVWAPSDRDLAWARLYEKHRGKIGVPFVHELCESATLAGTSALDVKVTTSALAKQLKSWGAFGPPTGKTRNPTAKEKQQYPAIKPLAKSEWTLLGTTAPATHPANVTLPAQDKSVPAQDADDRPLWRGTLLPQTDADLWLAMAFADYHDLAAQEKTRCRKGEPPASAALKLEKELQKCRTQYANASKAGNVALADLKRSVTSDAWYRLAAAKGVLLLHQLRLELGTQAFEQAMDEFGMKHGGQRVTSQQFQQHVESRTGRDLGPFFAYWLRAKGLPNLEEP